MLVSFDVTVKSVHTVKLQGKQGSVLCKLQCYEVMFRSSNRRNIQDIDDWLLIYVLKVCVLIDLPMAVDIDSRCLYRLS